VYSIVSMSSVSSRPAPAVPREADTLVVRGPRLGLRYATLDDAPALFALGRDPAVTRFFSWGPYERVEEPEAYIATLPRKRETGELLDFAIEHRESGVIGITGLSEVVRRDRRAVIGTWVGHAFWGSGANFEAKALIAALAFRLLGMERLTAWSGVHNGRSQAALARIGFTREGVLAAWHRHGAVAHDVVVFGLLRAAWERGPLHDVPVDLQGTPPPGFRVA
jgi:[ribosomal protein S5]-alanine N-acetyltransferase